jgi:prepilin-type N-terminal cleavage/methylation domain-containing protein
MKRFKNAQRGFTLMELMVVIVIVAILAAVAVPLYINYVNDARDTEAKGAIGAVITAEQAYHQQNGTYVDLAAFVANPAPGSQNGLNCDVTDALRNWGIAVSGSTGTAFSVVATSKITGYTRTVTYNYPPLANTNPWIIGP